MPLRPLRRGLIVGISLMSPPEHNALPPNLGLVGKAASLICVNRKEVRLHGLFCSRRFG
ncbi:hypothetical protein CUJ84_Chr002585 [Rhizobium leguminosarum]|uniref:Uncharacterized protein n=1 Tax=Rhizobium leguminosarum TaxID=384 RepID=A0A2K9Z425_RHILE|nr:hypothetical protein CUJ84_Chr002585 [Rhizobium leguminosarum]